MSLVRSIVQAPLRLVGYELQRVSLPRRERSSIDHSEIGERVRANGARKIHYGCGPHLFGEGWVNADFRKTISPAGKLYVRMDLTDRHPFPDQFFDFGFSEDFIEHLTQEQSLRFLIEAHRTLRTGGVLRLSFPGLEGVLARHYDPPHFDGARRASFDAFERWGHQHFYSRRSLELVATHVGFSSVEFQTFGVSTHEALSDLETRSDQTDLNLYAELTA